MKRDYHKLGQSELTGSNMRISDLCYEKSTRCCGMISDRLPERWDAVVWYSHCCDLTLGKQQAGVILYGVVSSSGYGDGYYTALRHLNAAGKVDCIAVLFLSDQAQIPG